MNKREVLYRNRILVQYILYGPDDVYWYEHLCEQGIIPGENHMLLFVLGSYGKQVGNPSQLAEYLKALERPSPWMVCAFGADELPVMEEAVRLGGHCRVGFENNLEVKPGITAADNAELVRSTAEIVRKSGNGIADSRAARRLFPK
ncbi:MAG: 3-keto-5-aminohexanoate cleavage protein [Gammaproteobacteria bacterium]|nr:3-keto-5-aminohexanoate cleavage protein [Gammaproteobacteria bacterium]MDE0285629.1 3-keto-5-aminohexanoate cleavage protein [Gammaproteobacteria bacterium]MDE0511438.1 3-keto-5-aminohexanoate cleavage protein [Gammaproteobacteria bacterium]